MVARLECEAHKFCVFSDLKTFVQAPSNQMRPRQSPQLPEPDPSVSELPVVDFPSDDATPGATLAGRCGAYMPYVSTLLYIEWLCMNVIMQALCMIVSVFCGSPCIGWW